MCAFLLHGRADAHPLGNFTINHLSEISLGGNRAHVRYVLDMAEIPTYATMRERDASGHLSSTQLASWAHDQATETAKALTLSIDGSPLPLTLTAASARTRPGAGGLPTLYLVADYTSPLTSDARTLRGALTYIDATFPGRLGWRDAIVAPQTEPTRELTVYPSALLGSPRETSAISATLIAGRAAHVAATSETTEATTAAAPSAGLARSNQLADMLVSGSRSPWFVVLTLLVAIGLGALHALEPGHGKTLLAVSLVGARATFSQAAILAAALTVAHTAGVLALGFAIILLKGTLVPENIYPWITLVSGLAVAIIGARAIQRQIQARMPIAHAHAHGHDEAHGHAHEHEHHPHGHSHAHDDHGHAHHDHSHDDEAHARSHAIPGSKPLKFGPTVLAAMSGGVAPCPAALVVLFAAISQNVLAYGLVAIVFFSVGLAATLTGLGIGVVRGAAWLQNRPAFDRFVRFAPLVSAIVISSIGAIMVGQGAVEGGFVTTPILVSLIAALAIAGYAFSHPFAHRRVEVA